MANSTDSVLPENWHKRDLDALFGDPAIVHACLLGAGAVIIFSTDKFPKVGCIAVAFGATLPRRHFRNVDREGGDC